MRFPILLLALGTWAASSQSQAAAPSSPSDQERADPKRIEQLVRDLGGNQETREKARRELRRIGQPALPYLKKAAGDADAERAMAARSLLLELLGQGDKPSKTVPDVWVLYHDWANGIEFKRDENGHVSLTVPEKNASSDKREFKTYQADSLEDFKKRYPEVAQQYHVEKMGSPETVSEELRHEWEQMKERLGIGRDQGRSPGISGDPREVESWIERQEKNIEKRLKDWDESGPSRSAPQGRTLGVLVGPAGPGLRTQLHLEEGALVIHDVEPGSLAEKSGLRKYDVLTRLNERPIEDVKSFRGDLEKALSSERFSLDIVRGGKPEKVTVTPPKAAK
jgi:PDZ domain